MPPRHGWLAAIALLLAAVLLPRTSSATKYPGLCAGKTDSTYDATEEIKNYPAYLTPFQDSTFTTLVTRVTGDSASVIDGISGGVWGARSRHNYGKVENAWNADESLLAIDNCGGTPSGWILLDGQTYAPTNYTVSATGVSVKDWRWHPLQKYADIAICLDVVHDSVTLINVRTNTVTKAIDFGPILNLTANANDDNVYIGWGEGNVSQDGRYIVLGDRDTRKVFMVDMTADSVGPVTTLPTASPARGGLDWVSISPKGTYVVVAYEDEYLRVFDVSGLSISSTPRTMPSATGNVYRCADDVGSTAGWIFRLGHADLVVDSTDAGNEYAVGRNSCGDSGMDGGDIGELVKVRLSDGRVGRITYKYRANQAYIEHVSARASNAARSAAGSPVRMNWVYVSHEKNGERLGGEVVAYSLDSTAFLQRICFTHTDIVNAGAANSCGGDDPYWAQEHPYPSRDGSRVVFASNWKRKCGSCTSKLSNVRSYVADLRSNAEWFPGTVLGTTTSILGTITDNDLSEACGRGSGIESCVGSFTVDSIAHSAIVSISHIRIRARAWATSSIGSASNFRMYWSWFGQTGYTPMHNDAGLSPAINVDADGVPDSEAEEAFWLTSDPIPVAPGSGGPAVYNGAAWRPISVNAITNAGPSFVYDGAKSQSLQCSEVWIDVYGTAPCP